MPIICLLVLPDGQEVFGETVSMFLHQLVFGTCGTLGTTPIFLTAFEILKCQQEPSREYTMDRHSMMATCINGWKLALLSML